LRFQKAFLIANACETVYLSEAEATKTLNAMGISRFQFLDSSKTNEFSDTQVLLASVRGYTLICFRGTEGAADWRTNLNAGWKELSLGFFVPRIRVHSGFYSAWVDAKPGVIKYLDKEGATKSDRPSAKGGVCHEVLIGGHSLGGALAVIAGADLVRDGYQVLGIFTFGQPMVFSGDVKSVARVMPEIERFVFKGDPIPSLPPRKILRRYRQDLRAAA
jgi:predicted lipase